MLVGTQLELLEGGIYQRKNSKPMLNGHFNPFSARENPMGFHGDDLF